jgi:tRNA threonylcarbamoyladenosine biosynthesis protein TsaB
VIVLAIDTCLNACSAAVVAGEQVLARRSEVMTRGQSERLAPLVQETMAEAGVAFAALDRIGVTVGPGSFTGLRVGLAFARSLALALDRPCLGVSTLKALALEAGEAGVRVGVIVTPGARYLAGYRDGVEVLAPTAVEREALGDALAGVLAGGAGVVRGPGARGVTAAFGEDVVSPDPVWIARHVAGLAHPDGMPAPLYLRAAGATPPVDR